MLYYSLNKPIQIDQLVRDIQNLMNKNQYNFTNKVLYITIREITNHTGDNPIPKLTHHDPQ